MTNSKLITEKDVSELPGCVASTALSGNPGWGACSHPEMVAVQNYRNQITWKRTTAHSDAKQGRKAFGNITDILLFYTTCGGIGEYTFHHEHGAYGENYLKKYSYIDPDERRYHLDNLTGPGGAAKGNPAYEVMDVTRPNAESMG